MKMDKPDSYGPEIIMSIQDRNTTVFTCTAADCDWVRTALGFPASAEREALEHLRVSHSQTWDGGVK
jgi:hypothetical protein